MKRKVVGKAAVILGLAALLPAQALAQESDSTTPKRPAPVHPPAHITVRPLVQSYPGPNAVRQCTFWLATENRPSGTVIVPRQHCWWERG